MASTSAAGGGGATTSRNINNKTIKNKKKEKQIDKGGDCKMDVDSDGHELSSSRACTNCDIELQSSDSSCQLCSSCFSTLIDDGSATSKSDRIVTDVLSRCINCAGGGVPLVTFTNWYQSCYDDYNNIV